MNAKWFCGLPYPEYCIYISALMLYSELFFSLSSSAVIFISPTQVFVIFRVYALLQGFTDANYKISFRSYIYMQNSAPGIFLSVVVKQLQRIGHHSHYSLAKFHIDNKYFHRIPAQILPMLKSIGSLLHFVLELGRD